MNYEAVPFAVVREDFSRRVVLLKGKAYNLSNTVPKSRQENIDEGHKPVLSSIIPDDDVK